ncbi:hypothetical protein TCA2_3510 [Paenibacillus sp. TCA20]|nr:hypothetical protein TCA2_3510 [Paenibacillus sp. TCA20]
MPSSIPSIETYILLIEAAKGIMKLIRIDNNLILNNIWRKSNKASVKSGSTVEGKFGHLK